MEKTEIAVYGAGGFGRELAWLVQLCGEAGRPIHLACLIDDAPELAGRELNGVPVLGFESARRRFPGAAVVSGIGIPRFREAAMARAEAAGARFETIVHPRVEISPWVELGEGTVVCAGNVLTTNIVLGKHVQIHPGCTVMHDALVGDFTTLAPGVRVSGFVRIGRAVFVGAGAVIANGTRENPMVVGDGAVIGAAACVIKPVPAGATVAGVPAKVLERR
jgi:sugar O-acyltransferase (sialic acid O-acetyltransferase NeuD family)